MYSLWSVLNSQLTNEVWTILNKFFLLNIKILFFIKKKKILLEEKSTLEKYKNGFKSGLSGFYKPAATNSVNPTKNDSKLGTNELDLIKKCSTCLVNLCKL